MLEEVTTTNGTAPKAAIPPYLIAGKTGTANRVDPQCGCYRGYVSSFIGFAPSRQARAGRRRSSDAIRKDRTSAGRSQRRSSMRSCPTLAQLRIPPTGAAAGEAALDAVTAAVTG